jgi:hypothetical protein
MGYDITFLLRTDDPVSVTVKDAVVNALEQAGLHRDAGAELDRELRRRPWQDDLRHQRPLGQLVLGLAVGQYLAADGVRRHSSRQVGLARCEILGVRELGVQKQIDRVQL